MEIVDVTTDAQHTHAHTCLYMDVMCHIRILIDSRLEHVCIEFGYFHFIAFMTKTAKTTKTTKIGFHVN